VVAVQATLSYVPAPHAGEHAVHVAVPPAEYVPAAHAVQVFVAPL
jgi:hypothetical protein